MDRPTLSPRSRGVNIDNSLIPKKGRCMASRVEGTKCLRRWTPPTRRKSGPPTELVLRKQVQRIYRQNFACWLPASQITFKQSRFEGSCSCWSGR